MTTLALTCYILSLLSLSAATFFSLSAMVGQGIEGFLPYFAVIGSGLVLLFGVFALLWKLSA